MNIRDLRKDKIGYRKNVHFYFTIFLTFSLIVFFAQNFLPPSEFLYGLFISDVVTMSETLDNIWIEATSAFSSNIIGIYYIYFAAWLTHPAFSLLINLIFIYHSIKFISDIFVLNNIAGRSVCLGIILNPYLYLAVTGPNKEIPLLFATLYIVRSLIFKEKLWFIKSVILSIALIFIRDGYGVILLFSILLYSIKMPSNLVWKVGVFISFIITILYEFALSKISIVARNILLASTLYKDTGANSAYLGNFLISPSNPFFSFLKQIIRMIYNWLTLSLFPVVTTVSGNLYSIGLSYWVFGIIISISILACIYVLLATKKNNESERLRIKIAGFVIFIWSIISVSLFIQPRYLMPIIPLAFGILMSIKLKRRKLLITLMISISFIVILLYALSGTPPAKASETDLPSINVSFLINKN